MAADDDDRRRRSDYMIDQSGECRVEREIASVFHGIKNYSLTRFTYQILSRVRIFPSLLFNLFFFLSDRERI